MTNEEIQEQLTIAMLKLKQVELNSNNNFNNNFNNSLDEIGAILARLSKSYEKES